jgi:hypothetical protein
MLIDSNIIIYSAQPEYDHLRQFIAEHTPAVSAISRVEVLGYHRLTAQARQLFEEFFAAATILPLSEIVLVSEDYNSSVAGFVVTRIDAGD